MSALAAQTVVDATTVEFVPSADHASTASDGSPLLTYYLLEIFPAGSATAAYAINLGKPAPGSDGLIRTPFIDQLGSPLNGGTTYQARVSAVGPGGRSASEPSNLFASSAPCAPTLSAGSLSVSATSASGSVSVTAGDTCQWTATANTSWLSVTTASFTGNGTARFNIAANSSTAARTGTLTIAGTTFTVTQAGVASANCTFSISPTSRAAAAAGETATVAVTAPRGCSWTAATQASWLSVTSGATGTGNGTARIAISSNTTSSQRSGTVTIAGRSFAVTQPGGGCVFTVTPSSIDAPAAGSTSTFRISTGTGCTWSASGVPAWMTLAAGTRSGSGTLTYSITANIDLARSATLTIAGKSIVINQQRAAVLRPQNIRIVSSGKTGPLP